MVKLEKDYLKICKSKKKAAVFLQRIDTEHHKFKVCSTVRGYGSMNCFYFNAEQLELAKATMLNMALEIQNEWGVQPKLLDETYYK